MSSRPVSADAVARSAVVTVLRIVLFCAASGAMAGVSSFVFLVVLDRVTDTRDDHGWLLYFLPIAGFLLGAAYLRSDPRVRDGNATMLDAVRGGTNGVPLQLAPMTLVGTWATHLFGGSGGREGTAMQMSGALTDTVARALHCTYAERRMLLHAATGGAFGAVFGVPFAGMAFGVEEPGRKGLGWRAIVPAGIAAFVGNAVVLALGYEHAKYRRVEVEFSLPIVVKLIVAAVAFGACAGLYVRLRSLVSWLSARMRRPALATATGGLWIVILALVFGREYLGLSVPLGRAALVGGSMAGGVFLIKLVFTAVTSGSGFRAGEVTPLFIIGATLGAAFAGPLNVDSKMLAALGFVAVFAAASKAPLACAIMGVELFGAGAAGAFLFVCVLARIVSGSRGIYPRA